MGNFNLTEYSKKYIQKKFKDNIEIKEIIREILDNPYRNLNKPKAIKIYRGKTKVVYSYKEYRAFSLNLRIFYTILKKSKQVDITSIVSTQDTH